MSPCRLTPPLAFLCVCPQRPQVTGGGTAGLPGPHWLPPPEPQRGVRPPGCRELSGGGLLWGWGGPRSPWRGRRRPRGRGGGRGSHLQRVLPAARGREQLELAGVAEVPLAAPPAHLGRGLPADHSPQDGVSPWGRAAALPGSYPPAPGPSWARGRLPVPGPRAQSSCPVPEPSPHARSLQPPRRASPSASAMVTGFCSKSGRLHPSGTSATSCRVVTPCFLTGFPVDAGDRAVGLPPFVSGP